jgi:hypothetical protein
VAEDESSADEEYLHCEINEVVREYIESHNPVDIVELAARVAESLAELMLLAPEQERANLLAATIAHLAGAFLEKSGVVEGGSDSTH